jgi:L-ascorbate metabolism protein UlaG (beta-lactamase superfamily)
MDRRTFLTTGAAGLGGVSTLVATGSLLPTDGNLQSATLTDPVLFSRIGVDAWIATVGPLRLTSCALLQSQLPEIDLVLVSHAHFDHLDTRSLGSIPGRPAAVMAASTGDLVP